MPKDVILTPEGLEKLKAELEELTTTKRREVAERIKDAREYGDISENSEYDDAKNEQAMLEARIASLEEKLRSRDASSTPRTSRPTSCSVGTAVKVKDGGAASATRTRSSARPRPTRPRASSRTSRRSAARCSGTAKGDTCHVQLPNGKARELTIKKIEVAVGRSG